MASLEKAYFLSFITCCLLCVAFYVLPFEPMTAVDTALGTESVGLTHE